MPEYLSPGVYIQEIEIGAKPIEGVSTSTAGFLGETERGPTTPRLITSWLQFQRVYGSYLSGSKYLPYAVEGFFANGGQRCYIARITDQGAASASGKLTHGGSDALTVTATGEGEWGNDIEVKAGAGTFGGFKLTVTYGSIEEVFDSVTLDETSTDYYGKKINGVSNLVVISQEAGDSGELPDGPPSATALTSGDDGSAIDAADYTRTDTDSPGNPASRQPCRKG